MSVDMVICKKCNGYFPTDDGVFKKVRGETRICCPDCNSLRIYDAEECKVCLEMKPKGEICPYCKEEVEKLFKKVTEEGRFEVKLSNDYSVYGVELENSYFFRIFKNGENYKNLVVYEISSPKDFSAKKNKKHLKDTMDSILSFLKEE